MPSQPAAACPIKVPMALLRCAHRLALRKALKSLLQMASARALMRCLMQSPTFHGLLQAQETAEPQEYARPRRGLLASLTATWSDLSSDDEASSSGRRSGSATGASVNLVHMCLPCS